MSEEAVAAARATVEGRQRVDRWLWAARFFKTRSLARNAVNAGKVDVNAARAKPARSVELGDTLHITCPAGRFTVIVRALNDQRRPAPEARQLYEETAESRTRRERVAEERRARRAAVVFDRERPDRRARRAYIRFRRGGPDDDGGE